MTLTRSLAVLFAAGLLPAGAAAQVERPLLAVAAPSAWFDRYQDARVGPEQTETWSRTFKVGANGSLDLTNLAGDVIVTGGPGDEIKVDATKRVRSKNPAAAKQLLADLRIEAVESGGRVEIRSVFPQGRDVSAEVSYTVQVPAAAMVSIHTVAGDIKAEKVKGETRLESVSGNIVASGLAQLSRLKSVSGDVHVSDVAAPDVFTVGTVSGDLLTVRVKSRSMDVQTVSGDVRLEEVSCDRAQVKSVSGDVQFDGPLSKGGRYEFTSHSGDVRVDVAGGTGFELTANTFSGEVRSELPGFKPPSDDSDLPGKHEIRATVGDGSALVTVRTFSGNLIVGPAVDGKGKAKEKRKDEE